MTIRDIAALTGAQIVSDGDPERETTDIFCGDLLSYVMANAPRGAVWITIMNGRNVAAVAEYADIAAVIVAGGVKPTEELVITARERGLNLLTSGESAAHCAAKCAAANRI